MSFLQASGPISTPDVSTELDLGAGGKFNTNNAVLKAMAQSSSDGRYSTSDLYSTSARTPIVTKVINMTIGTFSASGETYYGYNPSISGGFGSVSSTSITFENGVTGTWDYIQFVNNVLSGSRCQVADSNSFPYDKQVLGIKYTFYHPSTSSTHVISGGDGSAFESVGTHYAVVGNPAGDSWLAARVGQTVQLTMEPRH